MKQRIYIDVNSGIGRMNSREERIPYTVDALLEEMKYYRVHASIVYSNIARDYSFVKGNAELLEQISASKRLFGVATVLPDVRYELQEGMDYLEKIISSGIKAFKLYPNSMNHGLDPFYLGDLAGFMMDKKVPLLIDLQETNWKDLKEVLKVFPTLNMILCNTSWDTNRYLFPLMSKYKNLHFDISSNQANDILKTCKKHFGTDRALFGTSYPNKVMGGLKAMVEYSGLTDDDKNNISYKNAVRLFNLPEIEAYSEQECMLDEIALKMDIGKPLDNELVIDAHTHLVDTNHYTVSYVPIINGDEDNLIKKMDVLGIDKMFICPWEGLCTDGKSANETSLRAKEKYSDRIEVYAMCNPLYKEDLDTVVEKFHKIHGFKGLKPYYCFNNYDILGEKYDEWFDYGNRNRLIMLVHTGLPGIAEKVEKLSEKYKDMSFLMAHSGASYKTVRENIKVVKNRDNVFLEITYTTLTNGIIEYMVEEVGADKVIFGTDMPMRDPAPQLAWVCYAKISLEDKRKILGGNIKKLLEKCIN